MCLLQCLQGDVRRPYPTEMDMRASLLSKFTELPPTGASQMTMAAGPSPYTDIGRGHPAALAGIFLGFM